MDNWSGVLRYPIWIFVASCKECSDFHELRPDVEDEFVITNTDEMPSNLVYCEICMAFHNKEEAAGLTLIYCEKCLDYHHEEGKARHSLGVLWTKAAQLQYVNLVTQEAPVKEQSFDDLLVLPEDPLSDFPLFSQYSRPEDQPPAPGVYSRTINPRYGAYGPGPTKPLVDFAGQPLRAEPQPSRPRYANYRTILPRPAELDAGQRSMETKPANSNFGGCRSASNPGMVDLEAPRRDERRHAMQAEPVQEHYGQSLATQYMAPPRHSMKRGWSNDEPTGAAVEAVESHQRVSKKSRTTAERSGFSGSQLRQQTLKRNAIARAHAGSR